MHIENFYPSKFPIMEKMFEKSLTNSNVSAGGIRARDQKKMSVKKMSKEMLIKMLWILKSTPVVNMRKKPSLSHIVLRRENV